MKKTFLAICLLLAVMCGVFSPGKLAAQQVPSDLAGKTLYYGYVETVDSSTEEKNTQTGKEPMYITFTRAACYLSDDKGVQKDNTMYRYLGEENNILAFMRQYVTLTKSSYSALVPGSTTIFYKREYLYFAEDYKRLNIRTYSEHSATSEISPNLEIINSVGTYYSWDNTITVYEQTTPP